MLFDFSALDDDSGINSQLHYEIFNQRCSRSSSASVNSPILSSPAQACERLSIDSKGAVHAFSLDFERENKVTFTVKVSDSAASDARSIERDVTVNVKNLNDNAPQFESQYAACELVTAEGVKDVELRQFVAKDTDGDALSFAVSKVKALCPEEATNARRFFDINRTSGMLKVRNDFIVIIIMDIVFTIISIVIIIFIAIIIVVNFTNIVIMS